MKFSSIVKEIAYTIAHINPYGMSAGYDAKAMPLWVAVIICFFGLFFFTLLVAAGVVYIMNM